MRMATVFSLALGVVFSAVFGASAAGLRGGADSLEIQLLAEDEYQAMHTPSGPWHYAIEADSWYDFSRSDLMWRTETGPGRTNHPSAYPANGISIVDSIVGYGKYLGGAASYGSGGISNSITFGFRMVAQGKGALIVRRDQFTQKSWAKIVVFGGGYSTGEYKAILYQVGTDGKFGHRISFMPDSTGEKMTVQYGTGYTEDLPGHDYEVNTPMRDKNVLVFLARAEGGETTGAVRLNGLELASGLPLGSGGDVYGDLNAEAGRIVSSENNVTRYNRTLWFEFLTFDHIPSDLEAIEAALMEKYGIPAAQ